MGVFIERGKGGSLNRTRRFASRAKVTRHRPYFKALPYLFAVLTRAS